MNNIFSAILHSFTLRKLLLFSFVPTTGSAKHLQRGQYINFHGMNDNNSQTQADLDNHSNQLNPNNDEYWHSREEN